MTGLQAAIDDLSGSGRGRKGGVGSGVKIKHSLQLLAALSPPAQPWLPFDVRWAGAARLLIRILTPTLLQFIVLSYAPG